MNGIFPAFCCLLSFIFFNGLFSAEAQKITAPVEFTLSNGLKVYINTDMNMPSVMGIVAVKAGGKTDPADNTGMAHYLEHMLFKGTPTMGTLDFDKEKPLLDSITVLYDRLGKTQNPEERKKIQLKINDFSVEAGKYAVPNDIDRLLNKIGSEEVNASTSFELTEYHNQFPPHELERWLDIYAERFTNPVFRLFQSELETVYEEKNRSTDNYQSNVFDTYLKQFFKVHPYGQQTILGHTEHLKNPSLTNMYEYFHTYYVPNNMALILSGPVDPEEAKRLIELKFSNWKSKPVPVFPEYKEKPFNGREFFQVRITPVKMGIIGYRVPPHNHPDEMAVNILFKMLNNSGGIGYLDRLKLDNKLLMAQGLYFGMNDYGAGGVIFLPKIIGQSLESTEELILNQINELKAGRFTDEFLEAVKLNMIKEHALRMENGFARGYMTLSLFSENRKWENIANFPDRIRNITRQQLTEAAQKYFGDQKLVMYSKTGFPKKDKLDKPPFKPVIPPDKGKSAYAQKFESLKPSVVRPNYVDFTKDFKKVSVGENRVLYHTPNLINEVFTLRLAFKIGTRRYPEFMFLDTYLNNIGPVGTTAATFKEQLYKLGCDYNVYVSEDETVLSLTGIEQNLEKALEMINNLLTAPAQDDKALQTVQDEYRSQIKTERGEPASMARALYEYVSLGKNSPYITRPTYAQAKKITAVQTVARIQKMVTGRIEIHFIGKTAPEEVLKSVNQKLLKNFPASLPSDSPEVVPSVTYSEPTIFFHPRKDARQCQVYFYVQTDPLGKEDLPTLDFFNAYFGNDMSSLVFQEVREYRSLAYATYGSINERKKPNFPGIFTGYVGCQADKTPESVEIMYKLIKEMPEKTEREASLREGLIQKTYSARPDFRYLTESVSDWELWGYTDDPSKEKLPAYKQAGFNDVLRFYQKNLKNKTLSIAIVGNPKNFNINTLTKYGKIKTLKESDFYIR